MSRQSADSIATLNERLATTRVLAAGVDEAGRGPLAGPVVAAVVIMNPDRPIAGLADSKVLSPATREKLAVTIKQRALAWAVGQSCPDEIDRINILQATLLAMQRAVASLPCTPGYVLVDGNRCPSLPCPATAIVKGDSHVPVISAASIIAKVSRDREMLHWDALYPEYGFKNHKGYPTRKHLQMLDEAGPCPCHRRSFAPVRNVLTNTQLN